MSKAAREHQVDANAVEPPAVTKSSTRRTAAGRTRSKTSTARSEHIIINNNNNNNDSNECKSAGEQAIEKKMDQAQRPDTKKKYSSKSGSSARSFSENSAMSPCPSASGLSSLAEQQKQPLADAPTEVLGPGNGGSNIGIGHRRGNNSTSEPFFLSAPRTERTTRSTSREEVQSSAPSFRGEQTLSLEQNRARHVASMSVDVTSGLDEFTSSLYSSRGAAVGIEQFVPSQLIRHGATTTFDANIPLRGTTGGGANNNDGNSSNPMYITPCTPARPATGPATEEIDFARQAPHHHGPSRSFDANARLNLQSTWYQLPPQTRDQFQDMVLESPGAPGQRQPSPLLRQEQPWHQVPQVSKRVRNNGSVDRTGGSSGGISIDQSLYSPERPHTLSEDNDETSPTDKKRKRVPYRCKRCGQLKNKHECPLKNSDVETRGLQTSELPPGTVFEANDVPLPAANGHNVFYAKPYHAKLHTHDEESGPFQHPTEATAPPVPRASNTAAMVVGGRGHHWGPPEVGYSQTFPSNSFQGVSPTMMRTTGCAVGVVDPLPFRQEMRATGNAVGVVTPATFGQDGRLVYHGRGGGGGDGGSAQQGEESWHLGDFRGDGGRFVAVNMGMPPPTSVGQQWTSNRTDGANTTGMAGNDWSSSLGDSRPPGGRDSSRYTTDEGDGGGRLAEDLSFRRPPRSSSALSSMRSTPVPTMPMPPPSPDVDRWRRDNPLEQRPSPLSIAMTPRLYNLERIVFSEGFMSR